MRPTSTQLNLTTYFVDARLAGAGDRVAIREAAGSRTFRQLAEASARVAHLLSTRDIRAEERVIIALPDGSPFVEVLFGVLRRGAVVVMVNPDLQSDLIAYFCEYTRATAIVVNHSHAESFAAAITTLPQPPQLLVIDDADVQRQLNAAPPDYAPFPSHVGRCVHLAVQRRHNRPPEGRGADKPIVREHD